MRSKITTMDSRNINVIEPKDWDSIKGGHKIESLIKNYRL